MNPIYCVKAIPFALISAYLKFYRYLHPCQLSLLPVTDVMTLLAPHTNKLELQDVLMTFLALSLMMLGHFALSSWAEHKVSCSKTQHTCRQYMLVHSVSLEPQGGGGGGGEVLSFFLHM